MSLTAEQLKAENYPEECWINVYKYHNMEEYVYGMRIATRDAAHNASLGLPQFRINLLYRIHVRLK